MLFTVLPINSTDIYRFRRKLYRYILFWDSDSVIMSGRSEWSFFMIILGLAELFKTMNRPDPAQSNPIRPSSTVTILTAYIYLQN